MSDVNQPLALAGMILFLLGLLNGFAIPLGRSPRLGLSAHLTAVQSGTFLIAVALLWPHIGIPAAFGVMVGNLLWVSLYALWLALLLAGLFGAGHRLPIAGSGIEAKPAAQTIVSALLVTGIAGTTIASGAIAFWMT
jgi:(hydroxyamino)benzene mutase